MSGTRPPCPGEWFVDEDHAFLLIGGAPVVAVIPDESGYGYWIDVGSGALRGKWSSLIYATAAAERLAVSMMPAARRNHLLQVLGERAHHSGP